ncbi:MAG: prolipoprotein diacylglyceryl transferase [Pseudomonadota bacterium]
MKYPDISPIAFSLGNFDLPIIGAINFAIRWYSLAYLFGVLLGWWLIGRINKKSSPPILSKEAFDDIMVWAIVGIILGGRLGFVLFYKPLDYLSQPLEIFKVWHGGMSFHGGLIGVIIASFLFACKYKIDFLRLTDLLAVAAPIGLFLGRIANFANGELYGRITDSSFAMIFPMSDGLPRHPSQLYEASLEGIALFLIMLLLTFRTNLSKSKGILSGIFLIGYSISRSTCEFFREPDSFITFLPDFITMGQLLSLPMLLLGIYLVKTAHNKSN